MRLVGGGSRCAGTLEMEQQGDWRPVRIFDWREMKPLKAAAVVCRQLDCGHAVSTEKRNGSTDLPVWVLASACSGSESVLRECKDSVDSYSSSFSQEVICSGNTKQ